MSNVAAPDVKAQPITTSSPEEQAFRQLFPQLPQQERLVQSCNCGLVRRKLVRMGRMYVTPLRVCFASSFIEEPLIILLEDVLTFERKTSFVCDTVVLVTKTRVEYDFTAFISTGVTQMYNLLKTLWSVREKYAAEKASSLSPDDDSDVSSAATSESSRTVSRGSSAARVGGADFRDDQSLDPQSLSTSNCVRASGGQEPDVAAERDRAFSAVSSLQVSPPAAKERSGSAEAMLEKSLPSEKRKSTIHETGGDTRPSSAPEIRRFFPSIPPTEAVKDSFTCCYQFGASRLGKMWITQHFLLFVSPMMESRIQINFADVAKIEKEQKLVLLDGFYVKLKSGTSMSFSNFTSRDAALNVIESTFQAAKAEQKSAAEATSLSGPLVFKTTTSENDEGKMPTVASMDAFSQVETDHGTALSDFACFVKEVITPVKLCSGKSVLDVFGVCFDDGSALLEDYHTERKDTDQKWEPWRATKDGGAFRGQRQFTCTTLVKAMMGKPYAYIEYQRYALFKVSGAPTLAVQFSSQVPGVMFGDAFRVEALVTFTQAGSGAAAEVTMRVFGYVQFLKSVWVKGRILSTTMDTELPDGYKKLAAIVAARMAGQGSTSVAPASTKEVEESKADPEAAPPAAPPLRPQTVLQRSVMAYGTVALAVLVVVVSLKSAWQTFFLARVSTSVFCSAAGADNISGSNVVCSMMIAEWNGVLSAARPALVAVYLLLIALFCGVTFKTVALAVA
ncbi:GRAM domain containing protein [Novymonas esmeraldas]|uniref:GRAM domain containing protein n=1 Tax=Novymonas esmeraldas TaxID=1808958 RepID=A0AAW0END4_9TRYP